MAIDDRAPAKISRHRSLDERTLAVVGACRSWPLTGRLAASAALVLVALALRLAFLGTVGPHVEYVTFFPAVIAAAVIGGLYGGVLAAILSIALVHWLISPLRGEAQWLGLALFLVSSAFIVGMAELLDRARAKLASAERTRQHEQLLRDFTEQAPVAIAMFDPEMRYLAASARWRSDHHLESDLIGRRHYEVFPETSDRWKQAHRRALAGEVLREDRETFARSDGSAQYLAWEARPWRGASGDIGGILIFSEDVTERKRLEEAAIATAARLKAIVDTAVSAIVVIDDKGILQSINPATEAIFGYRPNELIGRNVKALMPDEQARMHDVHLENYRRTGKSKIIGFGREVQGRRKDGSTFPLELAVAEWRDMQDQRFFVGIMRDITERKRIELELARVANVEVAGQLAGGIAHDFNNLLAVIVGNLEFAERGAGDEKVRRAIHNALQAVEAGANLNLRIRRMLSLAGSQPLEPRLVVLSGQVGETAKLLQDMLGKRIALTTEFDPDLWPTFADPGEIDSALFNLTLNARDAMPEGGNLFIKARNVTLDARAAEIDPKARPGDYVELSVADNGVGMTPEVLRRAKEPFFSTKGPHKGTGLGLSSVFDFVKHCGGFGALSSAVGKGATVSLYLPRAAGAAPTALDASASTALDAAANEVVPAGDGELILVVEDDDRVREITLQRLEALGYAVLEARSALEAIERLDTNEPIALVFSDIVMPGAMTGYDLARRILSAKPQVKVLLTSGYNSGDSRRDDSGALAGVATLDKPYTVARLARCVRACLDGAAVQAGETSPVKT